jgi:hypothetical protein
MFLPSYLVIPMNSKTLKILELLKFLGVTDSGIESEAVKALCKAYEEVHGVPATALEAIAWAVNFAADHEGVTLTVSSSELRDLLKHLFEQEPSC